VSDLNDNNPQDSNFPQKQGDGKKQLQKKELVEEYRLVPVDEYEEYRDDEEFIDIIGLLKDLWLNRRTIFMVAGIVIFLGVVIYVGSERVYYSETKLMPETSSSQSQLGQFVQQYENILGIQQRRMEDEDIRVSMYPYIVESLPFQIELMQHEVYFSDVNQRLTIFEYFSEHYKRSFIDNASIMLWDYTIGLPNTIWNFATSFNQGGQEERQSINFEEFRDFDEPKMLDPQIRRVANIVSNYITIVREPQTNFVSIGVSLPDAQASTEMVILVKNLLQEYVIDYRTEKSMKNLEFIRERYEEAKANFQQRQDSLATFQDRNINIARQSLGVREQRLQSDYEISFSLYNTLARRLQEAEIQVQEETPVFRIHEPATVPVRPAQPSAARIIGGSVFVGFFLGIAFLYLKRAFIKFRDAFNRKDPKPYLT
jgi:LPS O-antigen subunit length determinant protein (WzzB/FepE family)